MYLVSRCMLSPGSSVHPSITRVDQSKTVKIKIMKFLPYVAPSLQFLRCRFHPKILTGSPKWGRQTNEGWENEPFSSFKRRYLEKIVDTSCND